MHLILRHKSPKTGKIEEKHLKTPPFVETDKKTHVYTAILRASNNRWAGRLGGWAQRTAVHPVLVQQFSCSALLPGFCSRLWLTHKST